MYKVILCFFLMILFSCDEEKFIPLKTTSTTFDLTLKSKEKIKIIEYIDLNISLREINTNQKTKINVVDLPIKKDLLQGSYEVYVDGKVKYLLDDKEYTSLVGGSEISFNIIDKTGFKEIELYLKSFSEDLIIEEIFFTGSLTNKGFQYLGDKYFKLYNNTSSIVYADGLILSQSKLQTVDKWEFIPYVRDEAFTADAIIQIPGKGQDHPVKPGESLVIAIDGINHIENSSNSIDLSNADFEMYYPKLSDIDNPQVENVINVRSQIVVNNRGFNSFVLARLPKGMTIGDFIRDYEFRYKWVFVMNNPPIVKDMWERDYKIMNKWIVDAVQLSTEEEFIWNILAPSLDNGWTYCGKTKDDPTRYGKAVRRKVLQVINGVRLLKDTNNSTNDFEAEVKPSLMK